MDDHLSAPPASYLQIINPVIEAARGLLENGEELPPTAFVGNFATGKMMQILLDTADDEQKDRSTMTMRMAAKKLEADFVFVITEVWSLRKDKLDQVDAILAKYGSVGASPYRVDTVWFSLETRHGLWVAECETKPKGISKKKRTIGKAVFDFFTEVEGRFKHLLRDVLEGERKSTLH